jgi:hypothetical protein
MRIQTVFLGALLSAVSSYAQSPAFTFTYRAEGVTTPAPLSVGGTIQFTAGPVGTRQNVTLLIQNRNETTWNVARVAVSGSGFSSTSPVPVQILAGQTAPVTLAFNATSGGIQEGTVTLDMESGSQRVPFLFFLRASALGSDLIVSYFVNPNGNQTPLGANEPILFPATALTQTSSVTLVVTNRGNGPGTLEAVSVSGEPYRLSGLPLLPVNIAPDRDSRFTILFAPTSRDRAQGSITIRLNGQARTIGLEGDVVGANFSYGTVLDGTFATVTPEQTLRFPEIAINTPRTIRMMVKNDGNSEGRLTTVSVTGTGFQVADPPPLPATLAPGASIEFSISFTPRESGETAGRLRIDSASFNLIGTGLGSRLTYTAGSTNVLPNGVILFPNTAVGSIANADLRIENAGNIPASISTVSISGTAFALIDLPALPVELNPGESLLVRLRVKPDAVGTLNGAVQIDETRFTLRAIGSTPPAISRVTLNGPSQNVEALQQPVVSLNIAEPYPLDVTGKLTLAFTSESFVDDPAVQFATGGRTVDFRIPAGATTAIFADGPRQMVFQTGTVAGQIAISSTLSTSSVDITPQPSPSLSLALSAAVPQLRNVQIVPRSATSFDIVATGLSTGRSVAGLTLRFNPMPGASLQTSTLSANVEAAFDSWFQSAASRPFGSQFSSVITISISGDINQLQSVSVTATNSKGTSNSITTAFR